jgi:hypothetical protein
MITIFYLSYLLLSGGVGGDGSNVFDSSDSDTVSGDSSEGGLGSWSGGFVIHASSSSDFDVDGVEL